MRLPYCTTRVPSPARPLPTAGCTTFSAPAVACSSTARMTTACFRLHYALCNMPALALGHIALQSALLTLTLTNESTRRITRRVDALWREPESGHTH